MNKDEYTKMESLLKGVSVVEKNQKYGVVKEGGIEIVPPEYDKIEIDGLCIELFKGNRISVLDLYREKETVWGDFEYIEKVNNKIFKIAKDPIDPSKGIYKMWSVLIIDSDGISDAGWYKAVSVKNNKYLLLCTEIPIDEDKNEDYDEDESEWHNWIKENNQYPDFGLWEIDTLDWDEVGQVEGFEDDAEMYLESYLLSGSTCDNDDGQGGIGRHYRGYNGWDDESIDEAFEGDPELTWNVD